MRAATLVLVMLAMSASAAVVAPTHMAEGQKTQWAPTRNFSELNARAVFATESRRAASPYAGEGGATAAGSGEARYYDSKLGIFLSRDSFEGALGDAPSLHRFTYAHNRPLKYRDLSGRSADSDWSKRRDSGLSDWRAECGAGDSGSCAAVENSSRLLDTAATCTAIGMAVGVAAVAGAAEGLVGLGQAAVWTARTIAAGFRVGAPGVGLGLAAETALDFGSLGLNALQCAQGDQASCAGALASAVDAAIPFSAVGDVGGLRAVSKVKAPKLGGDPELVSQEATTAPDTKPTTGATAPDGSSGSGTWTLTMFKKENPHFVHTFEDPATGQKISVHRVVDPKTKNTVVEKVNLDGKHGIKGAAEDRVVPVPNIKKSMDAARDSIGPDGKPLNVKAGGDMNSCVSLGCEAGQAGGAPVPADKNQWRDWTYKQFAETPKK